MSIPITSGNITEVFVMITFIDRNGIMPNPYTAPAIFDSKFRQKGAAYTRVFTVLQTSEIHIILYT